jgi:hypothetical protein
MSFVAFWLSVTFVCVFACRFVLMRGAETIGLLIVDEVGKSASRGRLNGITRRKVLD